MNTKDPIYKRFLTALKHDAEENWHRQNKVLAMEAGISSGSLSDILTENAKATFETREALAHACGYGYEDFLEHGKRLIEAGQGAKSPTQNPPAPMDEISRVIHEELEKSGKTLTPEQVEHVAKSMRRILADEQATVTPLIREHQALVPKFKYKEKGLLANQSLLAIEELDRKAFFRAVADLESLAIELAEKKEQEKKVRQKKRTGTTGE